MKDKKVSVVSVENTTMAIVETDESEYCEYIRYSADYTYRKCCCLSGV